jgi:hypothetical protein
LFSLSARHNYIHALSKSLGGQVNGEVRYAPLQGKLHTLHLSNNAMRKVGLFIFIFTCFRSLLMLYWVYFDTFFFALYLSNTVMQQVRDMMEYVHILEDNNIILYMTLSLSFGRCTIYVKIFVKMQVQDTCLDICYSYQRYMLGARHHGRPRHAFLCLSPAL